MAVMRQNNLPSKAAKEARPLGLNSKLAPCPSRLTLRRKRDKKEGTGLATAIGRGNSRTKAPGAIVFILIFERNFARNFSRGPSWHGLLQKKKRISLKSLLSEKGPNIAESNAKCTPRQRRPGIGGGALCRLAQPGLLLPKPLHIPLKEWPAETGGVNLQRAVRKTLNTDEHNKPSRDSAQPVGCTPARQTASAVRPCISHLRR